MDAATERTAGLAGPSRARRSRCRPSHGAETSRSTIIAAAAPLFLALMLGLWCPFCRRQIVQIGGIDDKLKPRASRASRVVATAPENARLYFKFRPTGCAWPPIRS